MLAFIHFSMLKGIDKNENELCLTEQQVHQYILPAFKLDKQNIAKNLLKCLYWALTLGTSKKFRRSNDFGCFRPVEDEQGPLLVGF